MRHVSEQSKPTRRGFIDWLLGTSVGGLVVAVLYPVSRYMVPPKAAEAATNSVTLDFAPADILPNSARLFRFGNRAGIFVHTADGEYRAFSALCTHLSCVVQHREDLGHLWCACHNGHFDLNGTNISGPPPRPLEAYEVNVRGDEIIVSKAE
jgi:cytochrome b6-f complex iron-sulfur subunit